MRQKILTLLVILAFVACSDKEKKAEALKALDKTQAQLVQVNSKIEEFEKELIDNKNNLEVVKDDLNQVKQFQLLRTEAEREQQIRIATQNIRTVESNIQILESNIQYLKDSVFRTENQIARLQEFLKN
jgi:hypothetical protein